MLAHPPSPDDAFTGATGRRDNEPGPSYFEQPLLKRPHWGWNVITYLFLGGIMGGTGLITMLAGRSSIPADRRLSRTAKFASLALAAINPPLLISHLGRPERFLNMLRIVKFKSPMSLGVWGLVLYSGAAGGNVLYELAEMRVAPRWLRIFAPPVLEPLQALLGAFTAGYTGVLISATAIPLWAKGKRHIPALSVCSGLAGACALNTILAIVSGNDEPVERLERLEAVAALAELTLLADFRRHAGALGKPMFEGKRGRRLRDFTAIGGIAIPLLLNVMGAVLPMPKSLRNARSVAASALTLLGGYVLRETFIEAGKTSAGDPHAAFRQPE